VAACVGLAGGVAAIVLFVKSKRSRGGSQKVRAALRCVLVSLLLLAAIPALPEQQELNFHECWERRCAEAPIWPLQLV
jgi:hypothetical protein